ncbi:GspS/AspS pilotin family protein [Vibrio hippocampi]|uniref:Type II secretion system pilot lipoprotein GspS-beta n=1 Tax=Vibrio hippocampi TaxID=654686 RepID=A0ABM8ZH35_9VIBR|nr:GspS/AspS pilotin family protein [Vibrio hippocampi]CAH0525690.1 hypothetical protein VHP8226_01220 [Vibrio hippocampi]
MINKIKFSLVLAAVLTVMGCASQDDEERKRIEALAQSRASIISSGLPIESGPLSIMKASASNGIVEIMMLYNTDARGAMPMSQMLYNSTSYYCTSPDVVDNLKQGVMYRILMRNSRGQLVVDELISEDYCKQRAK